MTIKMRVIKKKLMPKNCGLMQKDTKVENINYLVVKIDSSFSCFAGSVEQDLDCNIDIIEDSQDVQSPSLVTVLSFSRNRMLGYVDPSDPSILDSLRLSCNSFQYNEENLKSLSSTGLPSR